MSKIITDLAWYPPEFPGLGRMPMQAALVGENCLKQDSEEQKYHDEQCQAANRIVEPPCCKTLHISLFFNGASNNLNAETYRIKSSLNIQPEYSVILFSTRKIKII
jgi:hypothetical protein